MNLNTFPILADRYTQKSLIDKLGLATAPWQLVQSDTSAEDLHNVLGERVLLKRRTGGYDGRGQHWLREPGRDAIPDDWHEQAIAEQAIDFDEEASIVGMRGADGQCYFYPLTLNLHVNGILLGSVSPLARLAHLQQEAERMLGTLMNDLDYVGVMAMECFRVGDHLLINELAPACTTAATGPRPAPTSASLKHTCVPWPACHWLSRPSRIPASWSTWWVPSAMTTGCRCPAPSCTGTARKFARAARWAISTSA
ncbi:ATP-grasp domain-containing protein [Oceanimonas sp. NS1]|nr:ATP-grasp domain-containing protein [Oceanimonas sp. NS1]